MIWSAAPIQAFGNEIDKQWEQIVRELRVTGGVAEPRHTKFREELERAIGAKLPEWWVETLASVEIDQHRRLRFTLPETLPRATDEVPDNFEFESGPIRIDLKSGKVFYVNSPSSAQMFMPAGVITKDKSRFVLLHTARLNYSVARFDDGKNTATWQRTEPGFLVDKFIGGWINHGADFVDLGAHGMVAACQSNCCFLDVFDYETGKSILTFSSHK